jgi:hypothetical protein
VRTDFVRIDFRNCTCHALSQVIHINVRKKKGVRLMDWVQMSKIYAWGLFLCVMFLFYSERRSPSTSGEKINLMLFALTWPFWAAVLIMSVVLYNLKNPGDGDERTETREFDDE